jgi:hypothetical protein
MVQQLSASGRPRQMGQARLGPSDLRRLSALGGTRTPNLLIRSQMLYPLSYERPSD